MDYNVCLGIKEGRCYIVSFANGKPNREVYKPGEYVDYDMIDRRGSEGTFVNFDPVKFVYDLRLKPGAGAIGAGNSAEASSVDIIGTYRGAVSTSALTNTSPETNRVTP